MTETPSLPLDPGSEEPLRLSGWRLWLAWTGIAAIVVWGVVMHVRAFPVFWEQATEASPAFQKLHVTAFFAPGGGVAVQPGGVAWEAGLRSGRLVGIEGAPIAEDATLIETGRMVRAAAGPVRLSIAIPGGDTLTAAVPRTDAASPEFEAAGFRYGHYTAYRVLTGTLGSLAYLIVALVLLVRQGRSRVALLGAAVFLTVANASPVVGTASDVMGSGLNLPGLDQAFWIPMGLMAWFLVVFPDGRVWPRWALGLPLIPVVCAVLDAVVLGPGSSALVFVGANVILYVACGVVLTLRYRRVLSVEEQMQAKWAFLGAALGFSLTVIGVLFLSTPFPNGGARMWWTYLVSNTLLLGAALFPLGVLVSLMKYRLWDAEAAWSRSAMAAALTLALTAIVAGGTALTQNALGASGPLALALATAAAALLFVPLQKRLSEWADHRFLRDLADLRDRLPQLVGHLRETESIEGIAEAVTDRVAPAVHASHVALVIPDGEGWTVAGVEGIDASSTEAWAAESELASPPDLKATRRHPWRDRVWRQPEDRLFPVRVALRAERGGGELATEGWLLLGPRPDGSGYGPDDLEAVAEIAGSVGRALQVVRVREDRDAKLAASLDALRSEVRDGLRSIQTALDR